MRISSRNSILVVLISFLTISCADLDVVNENEPDAARAVSDLEGNYMLAEGSFRTIHNSIQEYSGLALPLAVMADHLTMPWGITRNYSREPRDLVESYQNNIHYAYSFQLISQWDEVYKAISEANMVQKYLRSDKALNIENEQKALLDAYSLFVSGISHGYLGLIFDQAIVILDDEDVENPVLNSWEELINVSIDLLNETIEICNSQNLEIPVSWVGGQLMTNIELAQLANAYAARILISSSRTIAQNDKLDWKAVLHYAQNGHNWDFAPELGDKYDWYDYYLVYGTYPGWGRVDMRIINLLDHDYPSRWPRDNESWNTQNGNDPGPADPKDARLLTDFEYLYDSNFPPERGYYHFSHYRHSRYDSLRKEIWYGRGPKPSFLAWEVKLIEAEALLRTGNTRDALSILNDPAGPRKVRGKLPDVLPEDDILRYILDEKEIECFMSGAGISFFDMRRTDRLQPATLLHFPVPAKELQILEFDHYTIHWKADGINGSKGGWTGWDQ